MGLSGSGKSTLLRAVNGLNPVVRGAVRAHDGAGMVDVTHADARTLRHLRLGRIAMVFQQFGLPPWRTVRENVGLGLELGGAPKPERAARVEAQLDLVGLQDELPALQRTPPGAPSSSSAMTSTRPSSLATASRSWRAGGSSSTARRRRYSPTLPTTTSPISWRA